jgi:hypothetical protein
VRIGVMMGRDSVEITLHVLNWKVVGLHVELHVIW